MKTITFDETKYKLVPLGPTKEMFLAAEKTGFYGSDGRMVWNRFREWDAMLNAAPAAEEAPHELTPEDVLVEVVTTPLGSFAPAMTSGVRLTHKPTGISVEETNERSPHKNKHIAWEKLKQLVTVAEEAPPTTPHNLKRIAWELERTALGDGYYGNALRVAKDIKGMTPKDRAVLDRYATGTNTGTDHVHLQWLAQWLYAKKEPTTEEAPGQESDDDVELCDGTRGSRCIHQDPNDCDRKRDCPAFINASVKQQPATHGEPVGEVQLEDMGRPFNAMRVNIHFYKEVPSVGTKLYTSPQPTPDHIKAMQLALSALDPRPGMPNPEYESLVACATDALQNALKGTT
jgi:hypothetical protein